MDIDFGKSLLIFYRKIVKNHPNRLPNIRKAYQTIDAVHSANSTMDQFSRKISSLDYS